MINPTGLWHARDERIACHKHLPTPGSDEWWRVAWFPITQDKLTGWLSHRARTLACEACVALAEIARLDGAES